jgi:hypothetical protein
MFLDMRLFGMCADGGIRGLERRLLARGGASANAREREQGEEALKRIIRRPS